MSDLKTLKDIEPKCYDNKTNWVDKDKIREEAIKWVKEEKEKSDNYLNLNKDLYYFHKGRWVILAKFFNLKESDLK